MKIRSRTTRNIARDMGIEKEALDRTKEVVTRIAPKLAGMNPHPRRQIVQTAEDIIIRAIVTTAGGNSPGTEEERAFYARQREDALSAVDRFLDPAVVPDDRRRLFMSALRDEVRTIMETSPSAGG